jgi:hypothetical protein
MELVRGFTCLLVATRQALLNNVVSFDNVCSVTITPLPDYFKSPLSLVQWSGSNCYHLYPRAMTLIYTDSKLCRCSHLDMTVHLLIAQHRISGFETLLFSTFRDEYVRLLNNRNHELP